MLEDLQACRPSSEDSKGNPLFLLINIFYLLFLGSREKKTASIYFPKPAWGWWHGCHRLLLSHMALHNNAASESKSPRRRRPVCSADGLSCKRLVIPCYSQQHNCLVKDEWRQIGLRMLRLFPWTAPMEWACVRGHHGASVVFSTKGRRDKPEQW